MKIIGVTGSFGSGKSTAAHYFAAMGAYVIDHDKINHEIMQKGKAGYHALIKEYGAKILDEKREIDRSKLGKTAFSSNESVKRIERVLHPIIIKVEKELVEQYKGERNYDYIVFDTPLLFEAMRDAVCDYTVVVAADEKKLLERISKKFGLNQKEAKKRLSLQMDIKEKSALADFVIYNNGSLKELEKGVKELFNKIRGGNMPRP